jgi:hypothetical protein
MIAGIDRVFNGPGVEESRAPVEVETEIGKTWAG